MEKSEGRKEKPKKEIKTYEYFIGIKGKLVSHDNLATRREAYRVAAYSEQQAWLLIKRNIWRTNEEGVGIITLFDIGQDWLDFLAEKRSEYTNIKHSN